jgi:DNA polymerase I-like protein with 3'-5' exonuclease and polymerase domains
MMESVTLQPDLHKGLGRITTVFLDTYPWKWDTVKDEDPVTYSAKDAFVTALLEQKQTPLLKQTGVWPLFSGEGYQWGPGVMQTMPILTQATADGLKIDRVEAERWAREELEPQLLADQQKWASKFPGMNPHSPHEVKNLLYGSWKLPIVKTKEDGITVDEYALIKTREYIKTEYARQRDESPWKDDPRCEPDLFDLLLKIRETSKLLSTYAMPVVYSESAFVHPQYLPVSKDAENFAGLVGKGNTATGRLASSRPNIQNQPKKARRLYIPDDPDWCFVQFDYSRAELWSMAAMAKDDVMLADLASGDPYIRVAEDVKIERSNAKNVVLAGQYLAGANKISEMILRQQHLYLSPSQCRLVLDGIAARWWKTAGYKQYLVDLCKARGYVINPFGRVRVFYDRRAAAAVDFIPQSIVADILWCVLRDVALLAREYGGRFTTTVHDSILLQIPRANVRECVQAVHDAMARSFDCVAPGFHLPVSVEVGLPGASWADVKEYVYA